MSNKNNKEVYAQPLVTDHEELLDITAQIGSGKGKDTSEKTSEKVTDKAGAEKQGREKRCKDTKDKDSKETY